MRTQLIPICAAAMAALGSASPMPSSDASSQALEARSLQKRDLCELKGIYRLEYIGPNPDSSPTNLDASYWFLSYQGGVPLASHEGSTIQYGPQTIPGHNLKLPKDIVWDAKFDYGFKSCTVKYDGKTHQGVPGSKVGPGSNTWWCTATFECPGFIPRFTEPTK